MQASSVLTSARVVACIAVTIATGRIVGDQVRADQESTRDALRRGGLPLLLAGIVGTAQVFIWPGTRAARHGVPGAAAGFAGCSILGLAAGTAAGAALGGRRPRA
ncbi:MAG: hypothetical protein JWM90_1736 [Thermoleophilia bacterium]|nr:hypothetical protein [Thermoleophilia bacterium]